MKRTKIIATLGPACDDIEIMEQLVRNGVNVFRMNFSHGSREEHGERIRKIKLLREKLQQPIGILLDTKGPEIRLKTFEDDAITLAPGDKFTLTTRDVVGTKDIVSVTYELLPEDVEVGSTILIDDGLVELRVEEIDGQDIHTVCVVGGAISNKKGVNVPGVAIRLPAITETDAGDILFGIENDIDFVAASFIRKAADVYEIRKLLRDNGGEGIQIISKIENKEGVDNIEEIMDASDGIMVARGDLGVEVPIARVPLIQKEIIYMGKAKGKIVITATQMLDSMIRNPRPTRAEVNDVASSVYDGCDAVMLSGETAAGKYPVEAVKMMNRVCLNAEAHHMLLEVKTVYEYVHEYSLTDAVAHACCDMAKQLEAKAIITATSGGSTARMVAKYRPDCQIIASTQHPTVYQKLSLLWGVEPVISGVFHNTDEMIDASVEAARATGLVKDGDIVVLTAGIPAGVPGTTNMVKAHVI